MATVEPTELVSVTVDGISTQVPKGTLVIEAARQVGVMIPHFCYHPKLKPDANCRMCLVEVEKMPKLQTSCSTVVADGMVVRSSAPNVEEARESVLGLILGNHPLDCPVCDQGGRCDLQDFSHEYTPTTSRFRELKRVFPKKYFGPLIETQMNRCVTCMRCVRYCDEVMDVKALAPSQRGTVTEIVAFGGGELECDYCGGCVQICPVGALTSRVSMYEYRPWMLKRAETVCGFCGDGCQLTVQTKENQLIEVNSTYGAGRNDGDLCARGFFGYHAATHPDRLQLPLIRRDGTLVETTWDEALETVAQRLTAINTAHGPDAIGGIASSRCLNEDLYVFQKFMRVVIGTNQCDSSARYGHVNAMHAMQRVQGTTQWTVSFDDIVAADRLLLVGTNLTETNPITGLKVKEAVRKHGATLVTLESLVPRIGPVSNITTLASHHLAVMPDQFATAIVGLVKAAIEAEVVAEHVRKTASEFVQAIERRLHEVSWADIFAQTGLSDAALKDAARALAEGPRTVVIVGPGVLRRVGGHAMMTNLLDLLLLMGKLEQAGCGVAALAEENNDQGAVEMGATAGWLPGGKELHNEPTRDMLSTAWGQPIPNGPATSLMSMLDGMHAGRLKAMVVMGENPVGSLPPGSGVTEAFQALDFLVCQELFLTETAQMADVVLPACSSMEKDGTFTNTEGHVQVVRKAIEMIGESRPDWEMLSAIAMAMDAPLAYEQVRDVQKEIRTAIPSGRTLGPMPSPPNADADIVARYVGGGYAHDLADRYRLPESTISTGFLLEIGQSIYHSGKLSTRSPALLSVEEKGELSMNFQDAQRLGIECGDTVCVSNARGMVHTTVKRHDAVPLGVVRFPEHFDQEIQRLLSVSVDQETGVPSYRTACVSIAKV